MLSSWTAISAVAYFMLAPPLLSRTWWYLQALLTRGKPHAPYKNACTTTQSSLYRCSFAGEKPSLRLINLTSLNTKLDQKWCCNVASQPHSAFVLVKNSLCRKIFDTKSAKFCRLFNSSNAHLRVWLPGSAAGAAARQTRSYPTAFWPVSWPRPWPSQLHSGWDTGRDSPAPPPPTGW